MSDNGHPSPLRDLLASLSPSPPPAIDVAAAQASNGLDIGSQRSSNTLETAIVLDSDSEDYERFTRDIQDVRSRARNTQLSRSDRRRQERSQRRREQRERSQCLQEAREVRGQVQNEAARGRSRSLSGNQRHTSSGESSSATRRSDLTAAGLSGEDRSRINGRGSRARRPGMMQSMRGRFASPPRRSGQQQTRDTSPHLVAFSPPPRRSSLQLPPGFVAPGSITSSHAQLPTYDELAGIAARPPTYVQAELAQVELRELELNHRERRLSERKDELDRREVEMIEGERRIAEWKDLMARHQQELRELLERQQQEIERAKL